MSNPIYVYRGLEWTLDSTNEGDVARVQLPSGQQVKAKRPTRQFAIAQVWVYRFIDRYLAGEIKGLPAPEQAPE
jgi:hypothetical protein